jgi:lactoylglutathione lyase
MESWIAQYCIYVTDLERSVAFYEALGLTNTSRTEIPQAKEAIMENADLKGGKIQLAQHSERTGPIEHANAFWKLYINTNDVDTMYKAALDCGCTSVSPPARSDRWPVTIAFVRDLDGYLVEFVQRHPWQDGDDTTQAWVGQYCIYVSDLEATIKFYETLGLTCTSRTDIANIKEAILENADGKGSKIQLAQQLEAAKPIDMGTAVWKLYVYTTDLDTVYTNAIDAGYQSVIAPVRLERWPTSIAFVADPDGYQIELVMRHES